MSSKLIERFHNIEPTSEQHWRAINLFGRNVASYKFALAKSILDFAEEQATTVSLEELSEPFSFHLCEHLKLAPKQITSSGKNEFIETCRNFNLQKLSKTQLLDVTKRLGFKYVLDAFHVVNGKELNKRFFNYNRKARQIILTDAILELCSSEAGSALMQETEARWRLVETSWSLGISNNLIKADEDLNFLYSNDARRTDVTSCRDALNGYQKGRCFYCFRNISIIKYSENLCEVDHFLPHDLKKKSILSSVDGIWNLVLACKDCNRGQQIGKFNKVPTLDLLERLNRRNEYYISSHDPLRETIMAQTGKSEKLRVSFLQKNYDLAKEHLIHVWKPPAQDIELF